MPRILIMAQAFWPSLGGIEVLLTHHLRALRQQGYDFWVVCGGEGPDRFEGIPVTRLPFDQALRQRDLEAALTCRAELRRLKQSFQPQLVHVHLSDPSIVFHWQTEAAHPCPTLLSFHNSLSRRADGRSLLGNSLQRCCRATADSEAIRLELVELAPQWAGRFERLYPATPDPGLQALPLPFDPPQLLTIGRLVPEKGFDLAIRALDGLSLQHPGVRLTVIGDGPERADLELLARGRAVDFAGWVAPDQLGDWINRSTMLLFPSRWKEAFGLVALEAARLQRPVVATRTGGIPEIVAHGQSGLLVEPEDPQALAEAVGSLLNDPPRARQLGRTGAWRVRNLFSWEAYLEAHRRLYQEFSTP